MKFLEDGGVKLKVERGGRVFPESDKSSDIIRCFEKYLQKYNVDIMLNSKVTDIIVSKNSIRGIEVDSNRVIECDSVILSTGGMSYPLTGSTGDGYKFAEKLGHTVKEIKPSLIPLISQDEWVRELMGLSLKNVEISAEYKNKIIYKSFGEMLFTHFGLSGPIILSASRKIEDYFPDTVNIFIDLKPALSNNELDKRILKDFEESKNKHYKNSLDGLLPSKLIPIFVKLSGIDPEKQVNSINREERQNIVKLLKRFKVSVSGTRPIEEAIITRGGINVKEIDPGTMESKIIKGLFITGELLDVDAMTGGFNLQIAFSTGFCAGISC
jgi:predicted Rossmann fold flavoprotein